MSLRRTVVEMIGQRGRATVDDLMPVLGKQGYTRTQVHRAMRKSCEMKQLVCEGHQRAKGEKGASIPGFYRLAGPLEEARVILPAPRELTQSVARAVVARGRASVTDLQPQFPGVSVGLLTKALQAANMAGYIRAVKRVRPTIWGPGFVPLEKLVRVASVWELASPRPPEEWPNTGIGTVYRPLGDWRSEDVLVCMA